MNNGQANREKIEEMLGKGLKVGVPVTLSCALEDLHFDDMAPVHFLDHLGSDGVLSHPNCTFSGVAASVNAGGGYFYLALGFREDTQRGMSIGGVKVYGSAVQNYQISPQSWAS